MVYWLENIFNYLYPAMPIFSRPARHRSRSGEAGGRYLIDSAFSGKPDFAVAIYENSHGLL